MGLAENKNDIKTLFITLNTIFGLLPELLLISAGIRLGGYTGYKDTPEPFGIIVVLGILKLAVAVIGYGGAIKENKVMLYIYSGLLALAAVSDFVVLVKSDYRYIPLSYTAMTILDLAIVVLTLVLAVILAMMGRMSVDNGCVLSPAPIPYTNDN